MRIDRLDLTAFGPFTNVVLELSAGSEGVHLIYGPNEAGKSSALRAIRQLYRGIDRESTDNFVHHYNRMRIGARLRNRAGSTLELVRRKGNKNTLQLPDGTLLADGEAQLDRFCGGITADDFEGRFAIDHNGLVAGGAAVMQSKGELGTLLFAAGGSNLMRVKKALETLTEQADDLFKSRGRKQDINGRLAELTKLTGQIKEASVSTVDWLEQNKALLEAQNRKKTLDGEFERATRERNRLDRISSALELAARRKAVLGELGTLADVPRLSGDFTSRRREAVNALGRAVKEKKKARRKLKELSAEIAALRIPADLLEQAEAIEALFKRVGSFRQATHERAGWENELAEFESEAKSILRDLGRDPALFESDESLESLRVKAQERVTIPDLASQRQVLITDQNRDRNILDTLEDEYRVAIAERDSLGTERDCSALKKALGLAKKAGDLEANLHQKQQELMPLEEQGRVGVAALGLRLDRFDQVDSLAVPSLATIDHFRDEFENADAMIRNCRRDLAKNLADTRKVRAVIKRLALEGKVPTEKELADARHDREATWTRLKNGWDPALAASYEHLVRIADEAADRLRREVARITENAMHLAEIERLVSEHDHLRDSLNESLAMRLSIESNWASVWVPLATVSPRTPKEMLAWSNNHKDLSALARSIREKAEEARKLEVEINGHRVELISALKSLGEVSVDALVEWSLADLVERADKVIEIITGEALARQNTLDTYRELADRRPSATNDAAKSQKAWDDWQAEWAEAMKQIDLPPGTPPSLANIELPRRADLFKARQNARERRIAIDKSLRAAAQFTDEARTLASRVEPDLVTAPAFDPAAVVEELHERLGTARVESSSRYDRMKQCQELRKAIKSASNGINVQRGLLDMLRREARCESDDQLPTIESRSSRCRELDSQLLNLNSQLTLLAANEPLDLFVAEVEQTIPDALPSQISDLDETIRGLATERDVLIKVIDRAELAIKKMDGGAGAAEVSQEAEDLRSQIRSDVEQYARLRLARAILHEAIERYREKVQGPVLTRASAIFSALTLGSLASLRVEFEDKGPVLKALRPDGGDGLGVKDLSDGTADQLYLALRLATLETYLENHEPLPLIVDDILIRFSDDRAAATLKILADLSSKTQIIVFTHHEHLVELARANIDGGRLFTHSLSNGRPLLVEA
jgi:uncharacterized protein YhaN